MIWNQHQDTILQQNQNQAKPNQPGKAKKYNFSCEQLHINTTSRPLYWNVWKDIALHQSCTIQLSQRNIKNIEVCFLSIYNTEKASNKIFDTFGKVTFMKSNF